MKNIRPTSELKNNYSEIIRFIKDLDEPVILTEDGNAELVIMSMETYTKKYEKNRIGEILLERELKLQSGESKTYDSAEVFASLRKKIEAKMNV